jgi:hypothetical protein
MAHVLASGGRVVEHAAEPPTFPPQWQTGWRRRRPAGRAPRRGGPGTAVLAPKGTPHAYGNARRGQPARYLLVTTPKILALVQALH